MRKSILEKKVLRNHKMIIKTVASTFALSLLISASAYATAKAAPSDYNQYDMVWSDEFDGKTLNTNNWTCEIGKGNNGWGNSELQYYTDYPDNVYITNISSDTTSGSVDNSALAIKAYKNGSTYTSGRLITKNNHSFKYGRIEARLKVENGNTNAIWPAFWMLGSDIDKVGWPRCGELDIMEHANTRAYVGGAFHYPNFAGQDVYNYGNGTFSTVGGSIETWHTYAVEWDSTAIRWYLDDYCYKVLKYNNQLMTSTARKDYFIILNLAIGSTSTAYTGKVPLPSSFKDATMFVDYVRVYHKASELDDGATYTGSWAKSPIWNSHLLTFYDGSNVVLESSISDGKTFPASELKKITKKGYTVTWKTEDGKNFDTNFVIPSSLPLKVKLYANWTKVSTKKPTFTVKRKAKKKVTVTLKTKDKAKGFQVAYGTNKKVTKNVKKKFTTKKTYTFKLKSKKIYYFKVREYKLDSANSKVYSKWAKVKKVKVK